jgi:predicted acetyltransferase
VAIEIRPCRDQAEMADYGRIVGYVFADDPDNVDKELATTLPEWTTCAFVDGKLVSTLGTLPFTVRLNGAPVRMGGVTAVGTLPEQRRRGLLRKVMREALSTMRDHGQSIAILWASMAAIYQRFGYGLASTQVSYEFDPRFAGFQFGPEPDGQVELLSVEDAFPTLKQLYIESATPRNLHIHRSTPLWQVSTLRPPKKGQAVYTAIYRNAAGEPRGHVIYTTAEQPRTGPGPSQQLSVSDFVYLDLEAYRGLWEYIRRHDLVGSVKMVGCVAEDDPAPELLLEPRMLRRHTSDGIWMRIVDVEAAMPQRPYGARGELTFAVQGDDMCPWNEGTFLLETDGLTSTVRRVEREPELVVSPNALASLLAGHRSASHLHRAGRLEAPQPRALQTADALFRAEYAPHCPNGF